MSQRLEICTYCSMKKQYLEGDTKIEKAYLMMKIKMTINMWVYRSKAEAGDNTSKVQRAEAKEVENEFLKMSCDTPRSTQLTHLFTMENSYFLPTRQYIYTQWSWKLKSFYLIDIFDISVWEEYHSKAREALTILNQFFPLMWIGIFFFFYKLLRKLLYI